MKVLISVLLLLSLTGCGNFYIVRDMLRDRGEEVSREALDSFLRGLCDITPHGTIEWYFSEDSEEKAHDAVCDIYDSKTAEN